MRCRTVVASQIIGGETVHCFAAVQHAIAQRCCPREVVPGKVASDDDFRAVEAPVFGEPWLANQQGARQLPTANQYPAQCQVSDSFGVNRLC
ncbi:hypothetical protein D3C71_1447160 [compost metagenome]